MFRDKVYIRPAKDATIQANFRRRSLLPGARRFSLPGAFAGLLVLVGGCERGVSDAERTEQILAGMDTRDQVAQLVISAVTPTALSADSLEATFGADGAPGGIWIEGGEATPVARLTRHLGASTGLRVLVGADLNEGVGGLLDIGTELPPVGHLLSANDDAELEGAIEAMTTEARSLGIRIASISAPRVAGGFPYSIMDREDESEALSRVLGDAASAEIPLALDVLRAPAGAQFLGWDRIRFETFELPLIDAARENAAALILSSAVAPALTGDSIPLTASPAFYAALRRDHDWRAPLIADLREMVDAPAAAVEAIAAGADLVIVRARHEAVMAALVAAAEDGSLSAERIEAAVRRVLILKHALISDAVTTSPDSAVAAVAESQEERTGLSRDLAARLTFRRAGEILPASSPRVFVFDPEQSARSLVAALGQDGRAVEIRDAGTPDSTAAVLSSQAGVSSSLVVAARHSSTFAYSDSLLRALPDSIRARITVVRVGFGADAVANTRQSPLDIFAWGVGSESQLAAAEMLDRDRGADQTGTYAFAPSLRIEDADSLGLDAERLARIDRMIRDALEDSVFTAAAVMVVRRGGIALMRGYGSPGEGAGEVDPSSTLFDLASLSKVIGTTSAAASLIESGEIELDTPIRLYISEFRGDNKEDVTVRHLLSHTAGLPPGLELYYTAASRAEALKQVIEQPLRRPPGVEAEYSDLGMILLAEVVEQASDTPLDRLLSRRIFGPLGMSSMMYLPPLALRANTAPSAINTERPFVLQGVVHDGNAFRLGGLTGHAGLFGTAWDVAVFAQMMLNGGAYGGVRVLSQETVRELTRRQPNAGERALGWDTPAERSSAGRFLSSSSFGHTGYTGTSIWIDPLRELFVVLLTNRTYTEASAEEILDLRVGVHEAAVQAISDRTISRRPGAQ